jgi:thiol-disulfide isomerase/thioredoxin
MRLVVIFAAVIALAACHKPAPQAANNSAPTAEAGPQKGIDRSHKGAVAPEAAFNTPDAKPITLAKFRGVPVVVNLWATWCAPCVKELPTLDKLDSGGAMHVVAVSQDEGPQASVDAFLKKLKATHLAAYRDPKMALSAALGPDTVLPTTILYDSNGKEVWRYVGDLDWTGQEAAKLLAEAGPSKKV